MAAGYDGSIKINTEITTKRASSQLLSLENRIAKTADKMERIKEQMRSMETVKIPTDDYKELQALVDADSAALNRLQERMEKFVSTGGNVDSRVFSGMQYDMEELKNSIQYAKAEMKRMESAGEAFKNPKGTEEYAKLQTQLRNVDADMTVLVRKQEELNAKMGQADLSNVQKGLKKSIPIFEKFRSAGEGAMKKVGKAA